MPKYLQLDKYKYSDSIFASMSLLLSQAERDFLEHPEKRKALVWARRRIFNKLINLDPQELASEIALLEDYSSRDLIGPLIYALQYEKAGKALMNSESAFAKNKKDVLQQYLIQNFVTLSRIKMNIISAAINKYPYTIDGLENTERNVFTRFANTLVDEGYLTKYELKVNNEQKSPKYNYVLNLFNIQTKKLVWALSHFSKEYNITGELEDFRRTYMYKVWEKDPAELRRQIEDSKKWEKYAVSIKTNKKWLT